MKSRLSLITLLVVLAGVPRMRSHAEEPTEIEVESINGTPFEAMVAALRNPGQRRARTGAMMNIARYAKQPETFLSDFEAALRDSDPVVRASAAQTLGVFGERKPSFVDDFLPNLVAVLDDVNDSVRLAALNAIGTIGPPAYDAVPRLRGLRKDDHSRLIRQEALGALVHVTRGSTDQQDVLVQALRQQEFPVRSEWITALDDSDDAFDICGALLRENDKPRCQLAACKRLARAGSLAKSAAEDLLRVLDQPIEYDNVVARPPTGQQLQHPRVIGREPKSIHLRLTAAWALTEIDEASSKRLFDTIEERLSHEDADERLSAAIIVSRLCDRPGAKQLAAAMDHLERDKDVRVRTIARLGHLRLLQPDFQGQQDSRFGKLTLPEDGADLSDDSRLAARLDSDLDNLITRLGKTMEAADAWEVLCELATPNEVESAIIQGDWLRQFERKRHGYRQFSETLRGIDRQHIEFNGRTAVMNAQQTREPLRLYYFDGHWRLPD